MANTTKYFLNSIRDAVLQDAANSKIPASLTGAQAVLESGNGNTTLAKRANNLFGIKGEYNGQYVTISTKEWSQEKGWYVIYAKFRKYNSWAESISDHSLFLTGNKSGRYNNLIGETDWKKAVINIRQDGYATDPDYPTKLSNIIVQNKLYEWDQLVQEGKTTRNGGNPFSIPQETIKFGSKGNSVKWIQHQLNTQGYTLIVDGIAGLYTVGAIMDFQKKQGLEPDGIVGPKTLQALLQTIYV